MRDENMINNHSCIVSKCPESSNFPQHNLRYHIGVDEVGRGPWAGPVVACACAIATDTTHIPFWEKLTDSKRLHETKREALGREIYLFTPSQYLLYTIAEVSSEQIDRINIRNATREAMHIALHHLKELLPEMYWETLRIDGRDRFRFDEIETPPEYIIKGDLLHREIGCASIIAKTHRDALMREYAIQYPQYGFESHKGYGTLRHRHALEKYGYLDIHRKSFGPIKKLVNATDLDSM